MSLTIFQTNTKLFLCKECAKEEEDYAGGFEDDGVNIIEKSGIEPHFEKKVQGEKVSSSNVMKDLILCKGTNDN